MTKKRALGQSAIVSAFLAVVLVIARFGVDAEQRVDGTDAVDVAYLALGDSVAAGVGASPPSDLGYPALLADRLDEALGQPVRRINLAVPGETTSSLLGGDQLSRALTAITAARRSGVRIATITLTVGANDLLRADRDEAAREGALKTIDANLREILGRLRDATRDASGRPTTEIVATGYYDPTGTPPEVPGSDAWWLARLDDTIEQVARQTGAGWVEVASAFAANPSELTWYPRDIHPTEAGHAVIAEAVWRVLQARGGPYAGISTPTAIGLALGG
ncbi:MAG: SGNH/GDSL hydrolase family protein [Chloroflexota bacterium]|nr:SGNH/GDSL hydrolase family protein [Chloroflexota bacterium]